MPSNPFRLVTPAATPFTPIPESILPRVEPIRELRFTQQDTAPPLRNVRELLRTHLVLVGARQVAHDRPNEFPVAKNLKN